MTASRCFISLAFAFPHWSVMMKAQMNNELDYSAATRGINFGLRTPCYGQIFSKDILDELFKEKLPTYVQEVQATWGQIQETRISGLAPLSAGGPYDQCMRNGVWDPELQCEHGGPIPFLSCAKGSRGIPEQWPHPREGSRKWVHASHGIWKEVGEGGSRGPVEYRPLAAGTSPADAVGPSFPAHTKTSCNNHRATTILQQLSCSNVDFTNMDWSKGRTNLTQTTCTGSRYSRFLSDGSPRPRAWRPHHKKWHRGGKNRRRGAQAVSPKDPDIVKVFFANITSLSEKAKHYIISRGDDVVLLAETHSSKKETNVFMQLLAKHRWHSTASPARPTSRSEKGTEGGVLAAVKDF